MQLIWLTWEGDAGEGEEGGQDQGEDLLLVPGGQGGEGERESNKHLEKVDLNFMK